MPLGLGRTELMRAWLPQSWRGRGGEGAAGKETPLACFARARHTRPPKPRPAALCAPPRPVRAHMRAAETVIIRPAGPGVVVYA